MDGLIHRQVIKVNDKVVLQRVHHLPSVNIVGQDRAALLSKFADNLTRDLKPNGSSAALKALEKSKQTERLQPARPKMPHINVEDINRNLDSIEAQLKDLRSTKYASLNEKYNVENVSKKLSKGVAELRVLTGTMDQDASVGKVWFPLSLSEINVNKKGLYCFLATVCVNNTVKIFYILNSNTALYRKLLTFNGFVF